jgi:hypothetical protein
MLKGQEEEEGDEDVRGSSHLNRKRISWPPVFIDEFGGNEGEASEDSADSHTIPTTPTATTTTTMGDGIDGNSSGGVVNRSDSSLFHSTDTFLLTHVHMERLAGLDGTWNKGVIICSEISAKLLYQKYRLGSDRIVRENGKFKDLDGWMIGGGGSHPVFFSFSLLLFQIF